MNLFLPKMEKIIDPHKGSFTVDEPNQDYQDSVHRLCIAGGPAIRQYTTLANHGLNWMRPPTGSVSIWNAHEPFVADPFYTDLFTATVVKEITYSDADWTRISRKELLASLNKSIVQDSPHPPSLDGDDRNYDKDAWSPSLGDRDNYVGLFSSRHRDPGSRQWFNKWFLVCHAGVDSQTYEAFEEHLCACEDKHMTFAQVFESDRKIARMKLLCKRNRRRLIKQMADVLDVPIDLRKDAHATDTTDIACIDLETESNVIHRLGNFFAFYNQATSTEYVKGGLIVDRALQLGPVVLQGPTMSTSARHFFQGGPWTNELYNAFPTHTGRLQTSDPTSIKTYPNTFVWEGDTPTVPLLQRQCRPRDTAWCDMETQLGFQREKWGDPIELQPVLVKCSNQ